MMDYKTVESYILSFDRSEKSFPYGEDIAVFSINDEMFALLIIGKEPLRLSLRADWQLSKLLREKYESVMPGEKLDSKKWNTIVLSGQLPWEEVQSLIRHSYNLVIGAN